MSSGYPAVTERDFRKPEYADAIPEDYEFRSDGTLVRKDRWERAVQEIRELVGISTREFEIVDVIRKVEQLIPDPDGWEVSPSLPEDGDIVSLELNCGSVLARATYVRKQFMWQGVDVTEQVSAWKLRSDLTPKS